MRNLWRRKSWRIATILLLALAVRAYFIFGPPNAHVEFLVSKETTGLVQPLTPDGRVDYFEYFNARAREGVTADNNAAVLIFEAAGAGEMSPHFAESFFQALNVPQPDAGEKRFTNWSVLESELAKSREFDEDALSKLEDRLRTEPWSATEYPEVANWLKGNERFLELACQATKRPKYYVPLLRDSESQLLLGALLYEVGPMRELPKALLIRAMQRVRAGEIALAIEDVVAARQLGRLVGRGPTLIQFLTEMVIEQLACHAIASLSQYIDDPQLLRELRRQNSAWPPTKSFAERGLDFERYETLTALMFAADGGPCSVTALSGARVKPGFWNECHRRVLNAGTDWDEALRTVNEWYDQFEGVLKGPETRAKVSEVAKCTQQAVALQIAPSPGGPFVAAVIPLPTWRKTNGRAMGGLMLRMLTPAMDKVFVAKLRADATQQMLEIAFALATYRLNKGEYPADLAALPPQYLPKPPNDLFADVPYRYRRINAGYLLYSVGPNGRDDGGEPSDDHADADDIALRVNIDADASGQ